MVSLKVFSSKTGLNQQFWGKAPGQNWETSKLGFNDIEHGCSLLAGRLTLHSVASANARPELP